MKRGVPCWTLLLTRERERESTSCEDRCQRFLNETWSFPHLYTNTHYTVQRRWRSNRLADSQQEPLYRIRRRAYVLYERGLTRAAAAPSSSSSCLATYYTNSASSEHAVYTCVWLLLLEIWHNFSSFSPMCVRASSLYAVGDNSANLSIVTAAALSVSFITSLFSEINGKKRFFTDSSTYWTYCTHAI